MSFPNPAMLPFFAAGGAISGSSFGLFYTILMQVGYNYFGKRVLKGLNEGGDLKQLLWEVQQEVQPFSDSMLDMALNAMPGVLEKSMNAFANFIEQSGTAAGRELTRSWLLPHPPGGVDILKELRGLFPSLPSAGGVHPSAGGTVTSPETIRLREEARQKQLLYEMQLREKAKVATQLKTTVQPTPQIAVGAVGTKKRAGQSQILERGILIKHIDGMTKGVNFVHRGRYINVTGMSPETRALYIRKSQQALVNLLARYRF